MKKHAWKIVVVLLLAVAAIVGVQQLLWRQRVANAYNRINTELIDAGKFEEAAPKLEALIAEAPPEMKADLRKALLVCYKGIGHDVGRSLQDRAAWLRKAEALDPSSITPEERREVGVAEKLARPQ